MKKNLLTKLGLLALGLAMTVVTGVAIKQHTVEANAADETETINFGSEGSVNFKSAPTTYKDSKNTNWTFTVAGTSSFTPQASYNQLGSSKKPATSITLTGKLSQSSTISSLETKWGGFNGTAGDITMKVGDTTVGSGNLNASTDVTVTSTTSGESDTISITVSGIAKGVKLYYISYTIRDNSGGNQGETDSVLQSFDSITDNGYKTEYIYGENWEDANTNLVVTGTYSDGVKTVPSNQIDWSYEPEKPGLDTKSVKITATSTENSSKSCFINIIDVSVEQGDTYNKISKTAEIKNGGRFILAYENNALGSADGSFRSKTEVILNEDGSLIPQSASILTISKDSNNSGYYTIKDGENYLCLDSDANALHTTSEKSENCLWEIVTIIVDEESQLAIKSKSFPNRFIQYNYTSPRFACYKGTQIYPSLYEHVDDIPQSVDLDFITATDVSINEGSEIVYEGTYSPENATENIIASLNNEYVSLGQLTMNNGTFQLTILAGSVDGNQTTTLTLQGEETTSVSVTTTITITEYQYTHTLLTTISSLQNGSKVVIGNVDANERFVAGEHAGGNNIKAVSVAFNNDNKNIAISSNTQEFTVWCVDSTNGYYIFSDGGYYLTSSGFDSNNNYLLRTDRIDANCYFKITDGETGVTINPKSNAECKLAFNNTSDLFSLYDSNNEFDPASLYLSAQEANTVDGFVDVFMHMKNVAVDNGQDTGNCTTYFQDALNAYNNVLTQEQRELFIIDEKYTDAFNRLNAWAIANNYDFDDDFMLIAKSNVINVLANSSSESSMVTILIVVGVITAASTLVYVSANKRKKHQ